MSASKGKQCIFKFVTTTCLKNLILMKKICCCTKILNYVLMCAHCWKWKYALKTHWNVLENCYFLEFSCVFLNLSYFERTPCLRIFYLWSNLLQYLCQNFPGTICYIKKKATMAIAVENATFRSCCKNVNLFRKLFSLSLICWFGICDVCKSTNHET